LPKVRVKVTSSCPALSSSFNGTSKASLTSDSHTCPLSFPTYLERVGFQEFFDECGLSGFFVFLFVREFFVKLVDKIAISYTPFERKTR
jgi:hypothetical protein